jgi:arylsulfatase A-like enzyme
MIYLRKFDQQRYAILRGDYKLVIPSKDGAPHLYNLKEDVGEKRNLLSAHPELATDLQRRLDEWTSELVDPAFLGLIHSKEFQRNQMKKREAAAKKKNQSSD